MSVKALVTILVLLICLPATAQRKLIIAKRASPAKYVFYEGDEIRFKLKGEKFWNKALIQGLGEDFIRLHYTTIKLSEIEAIDISSVGGGHFLKLVSGIAITAGVGFAAIDQFNRTVVDGEPGVDEKTMIIAGGLVASGVILNLLRRKKVKVGGRFRLRVGEY